MDSKFTIEDIIKVLPFDSAYKGDLLKALPTLDFERKIAVEAVIKELYDSIFSLHYQRNLQLAIDKLPPETNLEDAFYKTIKDQTRLEIESLQNRVVGDPSANISNIREQLQQVMSEKQT